MKKLIIDLFSKFALATKYIFSFIELVLMFSKEWSLHDLYKILNAEKSYSSGKPGNIINEDFEICCGEGSIKVLSIQREGKKVQKIKEFLLGSKINIGTNIS